MHWDKKLLKNINYQIPLLVLGLIIIGFIAVSSAAGIGPGSGYMAYLRTQIAAAVLGILLLILLFFLDYRLFKEYDVIIYGSIIFLLTFLLILGTTVAGGTRWLSIGPVSFQPSEVAKIFLILFLAAYFERNKKQLNTLKGLLKSLLYVLPPFLLIVLQNDLGTALVIMFIFVVMFFMAGGRGRDILIVFGGAGLFFTLLIILHFSLGTPLPFLQTYQLNRLIAFVNPGVDPQGIGYNIIQAQIAVGSGMLTGKGFMAGTQSQLGFLPEKHTDFIFAVISEEFGFMGVLVVLVLYFLLIWQLIKVMVQAKDNFGFLIVSGVTAMFFFHVLENIGMTLGIMPITGIPLPFISYGGSSMVTSLLAIGLVLNINMRRKKIIF